MRRVTSADGTGELFRQLKHSWYVAYFQLWWLSERGWRKGWAPPQRAGDQGWILVAPE